MQLVIARKGVVEIMEAPDPTPSENEVLIETAFSAISTGTELEALSRQSPSFSSLLRRGIRSWDKIKSSLQRRGWKETMARISEKIEMPVTLGYSLSGRVIGVGSAVQDFYSGDWVAAAGPWAAHGTLACVPRLFCSKMKSPEMARDACVAAPACVGIHALHRADPGAGAEVGVFGLGVIGQFMVQALCASGCRVAAFDPVEYRRTDAKSCGAEVYDPDSFDFKNGGSIALNGEGLDAVFLCAKNDSPGLIENAATLCRKRGRLMVVGEFPIQVPREIAYEKELEVRLSAAYGEGRYDPNYEVLGQDYPVDSGRWTVQRNLQLFLRWLEEGRMCPSKLRPWVEPFEKATEVYGRLARGETPAGGGREAVTTLTLFQYSKPVPKPVLELSPRSEAGSKTLAIGVVGTGRMAVETHLPNLRLSPDKFFLHLLAGQNPAATAEKARKFGASRAICNLEEAARDPALSAILIATPHSRHAKQAVSFLEAGKHVLVEKPLCLNLDELEKIQESARRSMLDGQRMTPVLFVGFNRRFAPLSQKAFEYRARNPGPVKIHYHFRLPPLPKGEWYHRPEEGGRFIGEVCHAVDWILWLAGCPVRKKTAMAGPFGNSDVFLEFTDSSQAHLRCEPVRYLEGPKEKVEIQWENERWKMEDFLRLEIYKQDHLIQKDSFSSKGHRELLDAFAGAIAHPGNGTEDSYGFFASARLTLELDAALRKVSRPDEVGA